MFADELHITTPLRQKILGLPKYHPPTLHVPPSLRMSVFGTPVEGISRRGAPIGRLET